MSNHTEAHVLHHHGIVGEGDTLIDNAREAGLIYACLECASVGGINPTAPLGEYASVEEARVATRNALDWDNLCCEGTQVIY